MKLKHREELKDAELSHQREIQRLTETFSSSELILKDQINKLETIRTTLERVRPISNKFHFIQKIDRNSFCSERKSTP